MISHSSTSSLYSPVIKLASLALRCMSFKYTNEATQLDRWYLQVVPGMINTAPCMNKCHNFYKHSVCSFTEWFECVRSYDWSSAPYTEVSVKCNDSILSVFTGWRHSKWAMQSRLISRHVGCWDHGYTSIALPCIKKPHFQHCIIICNKIVIVSPRASV